MKTSDKTHVKYVCTRCLGYHCSLKIGKGKNAPVGCPSDAYPVAFWRFDGNKKDWE